MATGTTKLENMVNPEVMAPMVSAKLEAALKFTPLCTVDNTLVGRPGSTVTLPKFAFIGTAADVAEGEAIPLEKMSTSTAQVTIKKAGKGVEITDEAVLSGYGDPLGEAAKQLGLSIADKVDNDVLTALSGITEAMTAGDGAVELSADLIADALVKFGEDIDGEKILLVAPKQLASLRKSEDWVKATDIGVDILIKGTVGMIHGCQVVLSNKIKADGEKIVNYIVKPEALALYMKRDVELENDRDIVKKITIITADEHYTVHIADDTKAIKVVTKEPGAGTLGELTVTSAEGTNSGDTKITVTPSLASGNSYKYKTAANPTMPTYGQILTSGWTAWNGTSDITATTGNKIVVAEVDSSNACMKAGETTITSKA